ncbi:hypothetical protein GCM10011588_03860 [Nocardia jinanensis]|uniref:Uncharacterized protein n=1 Tax=Nocardia jinanensis TaxID=382504 RepID=A0A917R6C3_9NOCA|nr:hypothetical protein GCM10011588_03860 [Nocardia jinanensis]
MRVLRTSAFAPAVRVLRTFAFVPAVRVLRACAFVPAVCGSRTDLPNCAYQAGAVVPEDRPSDYASGPTTV